MTDTTTQPDPQLGMVSWRITEWFRDYRRTRPSGGTYGDAVTKLCQATTPIYGDDVLSACWTLSADVEPARRPLTVADIPAGQGAASLFIKPNPDHPGDLDLFFKMADGGLDLIEYLVDDEPGTAALRDHLAATLPTIGTEDVDLTPPFDTPQIHTDTDGRHWDDTGREHTAVDIDGETTYQPTDTTEEST